MGNIHAPANLEIPGSVKVWDIKIFPSPPNPINNPAKIPSSIQFLKGKLDFFIPVSIVTLIISPGVRKFFSILSLLYKLLINYMFLN